MKAPVRTVESGITRRGNWVLRTTPSWATTEVTAFVRRFLEEGEEDDAEQQQHRVVLDVLAADFEDLGEDEEQDPEQHQRPDQRPDVAEHGAEVDALELGHRDQPEQVEEAAGAAAEGGGAVDLAQLGRVRSAPSLAGAPLDDRLDLVRQGDDAPSVGLAAEDDEVDRVVDVEGDAGAVDAVDPAVDEVAARDRAGSRPRR